MMLTENGQVGKILSLQYRAPGALSTVVELIFIADLACACGRTFPIYAVGQSGRVTEMTVSKNSYYDEVREAFWVSGSDASGVPVPYYFCLADYNINGLADRAGGYNRHLIFADLEAANDYAESLKSDKDYMAAVTEFHREIDELYALIDSFLEAEEPRSYWDEDFYEDAFTTNADRNYWDDHEDFWDDVELDPLPESDSLDAMGETLGPGETFVGFTEDEIEMLQEELEKRSDYGTQR